MSRMPHHLRVLAAGLAFLFLLHSQAWAQKASPELLSLKDSMYASYAARDFQRALQAGQQALPLIVREYGAEHEDTGIHAHTLGLISLELGDLQTAERYFRDHVRIAEKVYGRDSPFLAPALESLAQVHVRAGRLDQAEPLLRRALDIRQATLGNDHAFAAPAHALLGEVSLKRGNAGGALTSYREAIRGLVTQDRTHVIVQSSIDEDIRRHRDTFIGLCRAAWQTGSDRTALFEETFAAAQRAWHTAAASALAKMTARLGAGDTELGRRIREVQDLSDKVLASSKEDQALLTSWHAVQEADPTYKALSDEFRALNLTRARDNAPALRQQTALVERMTGLLDRCPPGQKKAGCETADKERLDIGKELGRLSKDVAKDSDKVTALHGRMEAAERALPGYQAFATRREALVQATYAGEKAFARARNEIETAFPQYVALSDPNPLAVAEVRALLKPDEALVVMLVGSEKSFVWAVTRERVEWAQIDAGTDALSIRVTALRKGLDPLAQQDAEGSAGSQPAIRGGFDLAAAHDLYNLVLAPVMSSLSGKRHLMIVPTGPLTSLPLQVLVMRPPATGASERDALRTAEWLIKAHALSVLPSVQSLRALRGLAAGSGAGQPFFGVGDPVLQGSDPADSQRGKRRVVAAANPARFYRAGLADIRAVRDLAALPETADELQAVAKVLGAPASAIMLREAASETRVKSTPLNDYRVIQFATHGLVAGDLSGLTEPALVLTPPDTPTDADDGLLTASEIAALRLNADWVVLSACNTASGTGQGADALSGLARAFFYAGARALLVSHWAVYSEAAVSLTTRTFASLAADPRMGRAEAFRRTMLSLVEQGHPPSYWAPFIIVGEAGTVSSR